METERIFVRVLLALGFVASAGCSVLIDTEGQQCTRQSDCDALFGEDAGLVCVSNFCAVPACNLDADCTALGGRYADKVCIENECVDPVAASVEPPEWLCLDEPPVPPTVAGPFNVKLVVQDVITAKPLEGVEARACRKLDSDCLNPEVTSASDATGIINLSVAKSFSGYVTLTRADLVPTYYFFDAGIDRDMEPEPISLMQPFIAAIQVQMTGAPANPDGAIALITAHNCNGVGIEGVRFESADAKEGSVPWYSSGGLPSSSADVTDSSGIGGWVNLPPGTLTVHAVRVSDGRSVGVGSVTMKPGGISVIRLQARSSL